MLKGGENMKCFDREWMVWRVLLTDHVKTNPQYWSTVPRPDLADLEGMESWVTPYAQLERSVQNIFLALVLGYSGRYRLHGDELDGTRIVFSGTSSLDLQPHATTGIRVKVSPEIINLKPRN